MQLFSSSDVLCHHVIVEVILKPISQIPQCTLYIFHNISFRTKIFWTVHCGICDKCIVGFVEIGSCCRLGDRLGWEQRRGGVCVWRSRQMRGGAANGMWLWRYRRRGSLWPRHVDWQVRLAGVGSKKELGLVRPRTVTLHERPSVSKHRQLNCL